MRRLGLFAVLLSLVGLSTAVAASFDVQTEDIASFSTSTSISVPSSQQTLYLTGSALPATLSETPELGNGNQGVHSKQIVRGGDAVTLPDENDPTRYHTWSTGPLPAPLVLNGLARLFIYQQGGATPMTAGLFVCQPPQPPASSACQQITPDVLGAVGSGNAESTADFNDLALTVPQGSELRLKIINRTSGNGNWSLQWGFKENRPARLELNLPGAP